MESESDDEAWSNVDSDQADTRTNAETERPANAAIPGRVAASEDDTERPSTTLLQASPVRRARILMEYARLRSDYVSHKRRENAEKHATHVKVRSAEDELAEAWKDMEKSQRRLDELRREKRELIRQRKIMIQHEKINREVAAAVLRNQPQIAQQQQPHSQQALLPNWPQMGTLASQSLAAAVSGSLPPLGPAEYLRLMQQQMLFNSTFSGLAQHAFLQLQHANFLQQQRLHKLPTPPTPSNKQPSSTVTPPAGTTPTPPPQSATPVGYPFATPTPTPPPAMMFGNHPSAFYRPTAHPVFPNWDPSAAAANAHFLHATNAQMPPPAKQRRPS
ncbi:hypothetical protein AAVH_32411 [Aphelenchoides avenae]|nr:hypothetical protein AAVH_32411 [Aphelenchus avenae]